MTLVKTFCALLGFTVAVILFGCSEKETGTVVIGKQRWSVNDANVRTYQNGDSIIYCTNFKEFYNCSEKKVGACCHVMFDSIRGGNYGLLYNFYAVNDSRGFAPKGYKVPNANDWQRLIDYAGGTNMAGKNLKANDGSWYPTTEFECLDKYGFNAKHSLEVQDTRAVRWGKYANWWTSDTVSQDVYAKYVSMSYTTNTCTVWNTGAKNERKSVRFLKE